MSGLIRIFFLVLIVLGILSLVRGLVAPQTASRSEGSRAKPTGRRSTRTGKLFRDPVCGMYVTAEGSPTARRNGETVYFCSEDCLNKFRSVAS